MKWLKEFYLKLIGLDFVSFAYRWKGVVRWKSSKTNIYYKKEDTWFSYILNSKIVNKNTIKALNRLDTMVNHILVTIKELIRRLTAIFYHKN